MDYFVIGLVIYVTIGGLRVGADFVQPIHNQPDYVRRRTTLHVLSVVLLWPLVIWMDVSWYLRRH